MAFYAPLAFRKAPKGELLVWNGYNGKTWGGTGSGVDHHKVLMAPLNTFMKLNTSNGIPILLEYTFQLCEPGSWPFQSTMDINILPEACLAYDTPAKSENQLEEPANTVPETSKKWKRKGQGKGRSKSVGATSSASEVSPGRKNQNSHSNATLTSQVAQDQQLSSEGSDSDNLTEIQQATPAISVSQPLVGTTLPLLPTHPLGNPPNGSLGEGVRTQQKVLSFLVPSPGFEVKKTFGIILGRIYNMKVVSFSHF